MRHLSSEQIHMKWKIIERKYALRSITKKKLSKGIQYTANSNEENGKPKYLQNYDKGLDMGKHTFILTITIYSLHVI